MALKAKKGTPFAAQSAAEKVGLMAYEQGMKQAEVVVSGPGSGRETAIRAFTRLWFRSFSY